MSKYLLDTNVISEPLRPTPQPLVLDKLHLMRDQLAISAITWHEMWFGCLRLSVSARRAAIENYLSNVVATLPILSYNEECAIWHASERARLSAIGQIRPFVDGQIAAIAHANELILVTFNINDYLGFSQVQLEDWRN